jgi:hypothetical protein
MKMYAVVTLTNTLALQTDGPTPLVSKSGIWHDPEPVISTYRPLNKMHVNVILPSY